jgi:hypothetical protein
MAKSRRRSPDNIVTMPLGETPAEANWESEPIEAVIARRAYELYCARGRKDGHDIDDWLNAERELRAETSSTAA